MKRRIEIKFETRGLEHTGEMSYGYGCYVNGYGPKLPGDEDCPIELVAGECLPFSASEQDINAAKKCVYNRVRYWQDKGLVS